MRFTASTNYNQFLPCPGLNWSRYGIVHSKRLGYQLWQAWLPIMASTVKNGIACLRKGNRRLRLLVPPSWTLQPRHFPRYFALWLAIRVRFKTNSVEIPQWEETRTLQYSILVNLVDLSDLYPQLLFYIELILGWIRLRKTVRFRAYIVGPRVLKSCLVESLAAPAWHKFPW